MPRVPSKPVRRLRPNRLMTLHPDAAAIFDRLERGTRSEHVSQLLIDADAEPASDVKHVDRAIAAAIRHSDDAGLEELERVLARRLAGVQRLRARRAARRARR